VSSAADVLAIPTARGAITHRPKVGPKPGPEVSFKPFLSWKSLKLAEIDEADLTKIVRFAALCSF
jgi:hypothetical protein